jgi:phosphatidylinositol alpha-mannosyltransferase
VHGATGARLRIVGADPLAVRYLLGREGVPEDGIDLLGSISADALDRELAQAKLLVAPSLGRESFGMVLTRAFAAATPVVASDIDGYRQLVSAGGGTLVPAGDEQRLAHAVVALYRDEPRRRRAAVSARELAVRAYGWPLVASRLRELYAELLARPAT